MSAWYILSALGFYPVHPASGFFDIGIPLHRYAEVKLGDTGRTLIIRAKSFSADKPYVGRVTLNGKPLDNLQISYEQIMAGGELVFEMIDQPTSKQDHASESKPAQTAHFVLREASLGSGPPEAGTASRVTCPFSERVKAISRPSGDRGGKQSSPGCRVRRNAESLLFSLDMSKLLRWSGDLLPVGRDIRPLLTGQRARSSQRLDSQLVRDG